MARPRIIETPFAGVFLVEPDIHRDERGFLVETYRVDSWPAATLVQENHTRSVRRSLRGMHFQLGLGQTKLVRVATGRIFDAVVDLRPDSATFGRWHAFTLDSERQQQLFIPSGFAHGLCVLSEAADIIYKLDAYYDPKEQVTFRWNDPEIGIEWPIDNPILSDRDANAELFCTVRKRLGR